MFPALQTGLPGGLPDARLKFDNKSLKTAKKRLLLRVGNVILGVEAGHYTRWRKTPDTPQTALLRFAKRRYASTDAEFRHFLTLFWD